MWDTHLHAKHSVTKSKMNNSYKNCNQWNKVFRLCSFVSVTQILLSSLTPFTFSVGQVACFCFFFNFRIKKAHSSPHPLHLTMLSALNPLDFNALYFMGILGWEKKCGPKFLSASYSSYNWESPFLRSLSLLLICSCHIETESSRMC